MAWRLAGSLVQLRNEFNALAPNRSRVSDGTLGDPAHASRASRHNPNNAGVVCALDITHDPSGGVDVHAIARSLVSKAKAGRTNPCFEYVISNGQIASRLKSWTWSRYTGTNPHVKHAHFAVGRGSDSEPTQPYDTTTSWGLSSAPVPAGERILKLTSPMMSGPDVRVAQELLSLGGFLSPGDVDGLFGPRTQSAVEVFQGRYKLLVDGAIGPQTWSALRLYNQRSFAEGEEMITAIGGYTVGNQYVVLGIGSDNATLYSKWFDNSLGWHASYNWRALGPVVGAVHATVGQGPFANQLHVLAVTPPARNVNHWYFANNAWSGPENLGGVIGQLASPGTGSVIVRDPDTDPSVGFCYQEGTNVSWITSMGMAHELMRQCGQTAPKPWSAADFDALTWRGPSNNPNYVDKDTVPDVDEAALAVALAPLVKAGVSKAEVEQAVKDALKAGTG